MWWVHAEGRAPGQTPGPRSTWPLQPGHPSFAYPPGVRTGTDRNCACANSGRTTAPIGLRARIRVVPSLTRPPAHRSSKIASASIGIRARSADNGPCWQPRYALDYLPLDGGYKDRRQATSVGSELHHPEGAARAFGCFRVRDVRRSAGFELGSQNQTASSSRLYPNLPRFTVSWQGSRRPRSVFACSAPELARFELQLPEGHPRVACATFPLQSECSLLQFDSRLLYLLLRYIHCPARRITA